MILHLGGQFSFYLPGHPRQLEVFLEEPVRLNRLLVDLGIPAAEIQIVVVNGAQVNLQEAWVSQPDEVKLFPPISGGSTPDLSLEMGLALPIRRGWIGAFPFPGD
jgi:sulfur carrier protein ThiS